MNVLSLGLFSKKLTHVIKDVIFQHKKCPFLMKDGEMTKRLLICTSLKILTKSRDITLLFKILLYTTSLALWFCLGLGNRDM